jgi:hypothetical protein
MDAAVPRLRCSFRKPNYLETHDECPISLRIASSRSLITGANAKNGWSVAQPYSAQWAQVTTPRAEAQTRMPQVAAWAVLVLFPDEQPSQMQASAPSSLPPNWAAHFFAVSSRPARSFFWVAM